MNSKQFPNVNSAYQEILRDLIVNGILVDSTSDPTSVGSHFGTRKRQIKETIGYSFTIESPNDRIVFLKSRRINLPFAVANSIWTMAGLDNLEFINFYNERGAQFSDDQMTLYGAHGKRLFNAGGINQIAAIVKRLKEDPYSRRTAAVIYHPADNQAASKDIPCLVAIQFLQRNGRLHAITYMRSQSAAMVLPYDVFALTFLQEALAVELGLELGKYYHTSGSFHYYIDEETLIQNIIAEDSGADLSFVHVPKMPRTVSPFSMIRTLLDLENQMRQQILRSIDDFEIHTNIPEYWENLGIILAVKIAEKFGRDRKGYISRLPEYYARHFYTERANR